MQILFCHLQVNKCIIPAICIKVSINNINISSVFTMRYIYIYIYKTTKPITCYDMYQGTKLQPKLEPSATAPKVKIQRLCFDVGSHGI